MSTFGGGKSWSEHSAKSAMSMDVGAATATATAAVPATATAPATAVTGLLEESDESEQSARKRRRVAGLDVVAVATQLRQPASLSGAELLSLLEQLDAFPMTLDVLRKSNVAKAVKALRDHTNARVASAACELFTRWKREAKMSGLGAPASPAATVGVAKNATVSNAKRRQRAADALLERGAVATFYSKSKDADDLGLGRPDWPKVLSNFHPVEIEVDGRRYSSVEHAFHAAKARCSSNPKVAAQFEVGGRVPRDPLAAKMAGGRKGFQKLGAVLNVARWNRERDAATMAALRARLACDDLFREILAAVHAKDLQLLHFERGGAKSYWGGNVRKADGVMVGRNRLGEMLMQLAAECSNC